MSKILKVLRGTLVLSMFLGVNTQKAEAFGFLPPMPPEPVVDFPDELGKIFSVAQAYYQKAQTLQSKLATFKLDAIKKGDLFALKEALAMLEGQGDNKAPNKGAIKTSTVLDLDDNDLLDETALFNAHNKLFFKYPSLTDYDIMFAPDENGNREADYAAMQTAYDKEGALYRQDILIDTYLTARVTEDYLVTVERTINRLDACQKQPDPSNCTFFGMQMEDLQSLPEAPEGGDNSTDPGQIGAAKNAYIVTMVYDRLMRIVEDLTATEALYQSAKQTDMADPVQPKGTEKNSNAEDYIPTTYHFAYTTTHEHSHAKAGKFILNKEGPERTECSEKDPGCPKQNKTGKHEDIMEDTEILQKLQPIDILLREAINIHNAKNQMPSYKTEYRKYLRAIAIHKRALQAVYDADQCAVKFLTAHSTSPTTDWATKWGAARGTTERQINNYDERQGSISHDLLREYQKHTTNTILGSNECEGYYPKDQCADGYKSDTDNPCASNGDLYPCILENGVTFNYTDEENGISDNELDYVSNAEDVENISIDNRIRTEWSWRIGADKIMELTENHEIAFEPWNDQKNLQTQYLRQKYKNITNIIKTTDQSLMSYKIAKAKGEKSEPDAEDAAIQDKIKRLVNGATECKTATAARSDVRRDYCGEYDGRSFTETEYDSDAEMEVTKNITLRCDVEADENKGTVSYKQVKVVDGEETIMGSGSIEQIVSYSGNRCKYKTGNTSSFEFASATSSCPGNWDLTKSFLVRKYVPSEIGGCAADGAAKFAADEDHTARLIARNKLEDVITQRKDSAEVVLKLIKDYNAAQERRKNELKYIKQQMTSYNDSVDKATKEKNILESELRKSKDRIESIETEISNIENRKAKSESKENICFADYQIMMLRNEQSCIRGNGATALSCPSSCGDISEKKQPDACTGEVETVACDDADKGYVTTASKMIAAQTTKEPTAADRKIRSMYLIPSEAETEKDSRQHRIEVATQAKKSLQESANAKQNEIDEAAEAFTATRDEGGKHVSEVGPNEQASYIVTVEDEQALIEKANEEFENFLADLNENEGERMWDRDRTHCTQRILGICIHETRPTAVGSDNLETTLKEFFDYNGDNIATTIREKMEARWAAAAEAALNGAVPGGKFVVDSSFSTQPLAIGPSSGVAPITMAEIIAAIKDQVIQAAAEKVASNITDSDRITKEELLAAISDVRSLTLAYGIDGEDNPSEVQQEKISNHSNYGRDEQDNSPKEITKAHESLIALLKEPTSANRSILNDAGVDLGNIFGINEDIEKITDEEYFVGLPARGVNYAGENTLASDENAGRDYRAPKEPLLNLPPVREVFYFDSQDYLDVPTKNSRVAVAYLLNKKFPSVKDAGAREWEYMPEVWRYLLARPNVRNDQKYQQTFVERSYKVAELKDLTEGKDTSKYNTIVARSGSYPCVLSGTVLDVEGSTDIGNIKFKSALSAAPVTQKCKEIAPNGLSILSDNAISKENLCYLYNKNRQGICHLLADHGKNKDTQERISSSRGLIDYFKDYSELGQFLKIGNRRVFGPIVIEDTSAYYRDIQKSIAEYLTKDQDQQDNSITRQKAELASFRRNLMGSFINTVSAEQQAKKTRDNLKTNVIKSLTNLCSEIHENGKSVSSTLNDEKYLELDAAGKTAMDEACAQYLVAGEGKRSGGIAVGLAVASDDKKDTKYGNSAEFSGNDASKFGGISCIGSAPNTGSYYENIFCLLDSLKAQKIHEVEEKLSEVKGMKGFDTGYVTERIDEIERLLEVLKKDENEVVFITPNVKKENISDDIRTAKADRTAERVSDEEAITSMDNGSQVVPYCPIY